MTGHGLLASTLWQRAQQFDIANKECITPFYMFIWKVCKSLCFVISVRLLSIFKERKDLLMRLCLLIYFFFYHLAVILRRVFSYTICMRFIANDTLSNGLNVYASFVCNMTYGCIKVTTGANVPCILSINLT